MRILVYPSFNSFYLGQFSRKKFNHALNLICWIFMDLSYTWKALIEFKSHAQVFLLLLLWQILQWGYVWYAEMGSGNGYFIHLLIHSHVWITQVKMKWSWEWFQRLCFDSSLSKRYFDYLVQFIFKSTF